MSYREADKPAKVYCKDCKHLHDNVTCRLGPLVEDPVCGPHKKTTDPREKNMNFDCEDFEPIPKPPPKPPPVQFVGRGRPTAKLTDSLLFRGFVLGVPALGIIAYCDPESLWWSAPALVVAVTLGWWME